MNLARSFNTTSIWILNIGTLKPLELPTEHFLSLAYDFDAWPRNSVGRFLRHWAAREFGDEWADEVGDIMGRYSVSCYRRIGLVKALKWLPGVRRETQGGAGRADHMVAHQLRGVSMVIEILSPQSSY